MANLPTMDFETYSESGYRFDPYLGRFVPLLKGKPGIKGVNASTYAAHPSTRVLSLAYDLLDGRGTILWRPGDAMPQDLFQHIEDGGLVEAHNSIFEFYIWFFICWQRMGWIPLPIFQLRCSAAKARAWGLPGALGKLSEILNPTEKKDKRGKQLITLLSIPKKPTKKCAALFRSRGEYPELHLEMDAYNIQDVVTQKGISAMIPDLLPQEAELWALDQEINSRGVHIDRAGLTACIDVFYQAQEKYTNELRLITGQAVQTVDELTKGSAGDKWLITQGVVMDSLDKQHVTDALKENALPLAARRALEIRQILGAASIKKLFALERTIGPDDRIRDLFIFCGAERTGRFAGRGYQPQNLKNSGPDCRVCAHCHNTFVTLSYGIACPFCGSLVGLEELEWGNRAAKAALKTIKTTRNLLNVESQWGPALEVITACLRALCTAAPGMRFICSDYSAIEAVVLAALAGEEWRLEVFRTHGKIYEASAAQMSGVPLEEILAHKEQTGKHHPLRKKGKIRELALGYGGWIGAMKAFGAGDFMSDDEIKADVLSWRDGSPAIVEFWGGQYRKDPDRWAFTPELYGLEGAFINAVLYPGTWIPCRSIAYGFDQAQNVVYCRLPSGRCLAYHSPLLSRGTDPRGLDVIKISFMGDNSDASKGRVGWNRIETYSGKLAENVTQAVARDILTAAMVRVNKAGYPIVLHVHDEIIAEVPLGFGSIEEFERLMMVRESWFQDWPIKAAGGWMGKAFRK